MHDATTRNDFVECVLNWILRTTPTSTVYVLVGGKHEDEQETPDDIQHCTTGMNDMSVAMLSTWSSLEMVTTGYGNNSFDVPLLRTGTTATL